MNISCSISTIVGILIKNGCIIVQNSENINPISCFTELDLSINNIKKIFWKNDKPISVKTRNGFIFLPENRKESGVWEELINPFFEKWMLDLWLSELRLKMRRLSKKMENIRKQMRI